MPIFIDEEENKKYVEQLYRLFKDYTVYQSVNLSHLEGSPEERINLQYNY